MTSAAVPCDEGAIRGAAHAGCANARATLAAAILGSSLAFLDSSVVNVALPAIEAGVGAGGAGAGWLVNAYLLPLGALVLIGGAMGDRYGRRRVFLLGTVLFTLASAACTLAPNLPVLLAARAAQGVGAALLTPASLALIGAAYAEAARGAAIGTWAAFGAIAGALGPVVGGWLVDAVGWRAIFLINLPLGAAAIALAAARVGESRDPDPAPPDWAGAALATAGLAVLTLALTRISEAGGASGASLAGLGLAAALLAAFLVQERRLGAAAMMPLALFSTRTFVGVSLLTFLLYAALGGLFVMLPSLLIRVGGYPATLAGAALLPMPAVIGLASRAAGRLSERIGPRLLLGGGPALAALGFLLFARVGPADAAYWPTVFPALLVLACGVALSVAPLTATVMAAVDPGHAGAASGVNNALARVAGLAATALVGFALAGDMPAAEFAEAFRVASLVGAGLALAAALAGFLLVETRPETAPG